MFPPPAWFCDTRTLLLLSVPAFLYYGLFPWLGGPALRRMLDPTLFNDAHWQAVERAFPAYGYRRAMIYALALSSRWIARRRFPGVDVRRLVPGWMLAWCRLYALSFSLFGVWLLLYLAFDNKACPR